jgi:transcriptional antiterminator NusG
MWYVIQTLKGQENKTANEVIRDVAEPDERVFVFENEMEYKVKGEWIKDRNPFFPGYIFVEMDKTKADEFDFRLRKNRHPLKLMGVDGNITPISPEEEEYLTSLGGEEHIIRHSEGMRIGDMIQITSGSFKGWTGEIRKLNRHKRRAVICVPLMGRDVGVSIGMEIIKSLPYEAAETEKDMDGLGMASIVRDQAG